MLCSNENEGTTLCNNVNESQKYIALKKSDIEVHIGWVYLCKIQKQVNLDDDFSNQLSD